MKAIEVYFPVWCCILCYACKGFLRGRSRDIGMTFISGRVHSLFWNKWCWNYTFINGTWPWSYTWLTPSATSAYWQCLQVCYFALKTIGKIRNYISQSDCERLVHAFITSKLDMCNGILIGLLSTELDKLQCWQNTAASLVVRAKKNEHMTPILKRLHWLPVKARELITKSS